MNIIQKHCRTTRYLYLYLYIYKKILYSYIYTYACVVDMRDNHVDLYKSTAQNQPGNPRSDGKCGQDS